MEKRFDSLVVTDLQTAGAFIISDDGVRIMDGQKDAGARLAAVVGNAGAVAAEIDGEDEITLKAGTMVWTCGDRVWFEEEL